MELFSRQALLNILICLSLTNYAFANRHDYYKKITSFSNNTVTAGKDSSGDLGCFALDYISKDDSILKIPKQFSLCSYDLFPFKYELVSFLLDFPGMRETVGSEQKLSTYLLTYHLLYFLNAPKEELRNYIKNQDLKSYNVTKEVDESLRDSFEKNEINDFDNENLELLKSMGHVYNVEMDIKNVFQYMTSRIKTSKHVDMLITFTNNYEKFKSAFFMVANRGYNIKLEDYRKLDEELSSKKKNTEVNKILASSGGLCIISFFDLCKHYQPKYEDMRDKRNLVVTASNGNFEISVDKNYLPGQEISYTYLIDSSNLFLLYKYGFVVHPNIFNLFKVKIEEEKPLSIFKFGLCRELGCVDSNVKDPLKVPKVKEINLRYAKIDESLLNLGRIKHLDEKNNDAKLILKSIFNKQKISYNNEASAWMFYYSKLHSNSMSSYLIQLLEENQIQRNKKYTTEEEKISFQRREAIYRMDLSYKIIVDRNLKASLNNLITLAQSELENLKGKYLSN
jgi:hypothetical protein